MNVNNSCNETYIFLSVIFRLCKTPRTLFSLRLLYVIIIINILYTRYSLIKVQEYFYIMTKMNQDT